MFFSPSSGRFSPAPIMQNSSNSSEPLLPLEGRHVLHAFYRINRIRWSSQSDVQKETARERFLSACEKISTRANSQLILMSHIGPDADWGFMLLVDDLRVLDKAAKELTASLGAGVSEPVMQYFSVTESSEYTTSEAEYLESLTREEGLMPGSPELEEKRAAFNARMKKYLNDRLHPNLPDWPVVCFYPMSKRRTVGQNWYSLSFAERKQLMQGHARVGRTYAGRILQLITGSTGLDAMEWGVTLFARNVTEIKNIVYEMRFDPVSADYAEFGDFLIGLQLPATELLRVLGLEVD